MAKDYTKELREKGQERTRLTRQLQDMLLKVAENIAESVPVGTEVEVDGVNYRVHRYNSNIGSFRTVVVVDPNSERVDDDFRTGPEWENIPLTFRAIDNEEPGSEYYLHRDFHSVVVVAERDEFLHFANNLPEIVRAFEAKEDAVIAELRSAFEKLRKLAEE
jgi:hypothetical protein